MSEGELLYPKSEATEEACNQNFANGKSLEPKAEFCNLKANAQQADDACVE